MNRSPSPIVVSFDSAPATAQTMRMALGLARSTGTDVRVVTLEDQPTELAHEDALWHMHEAVTELELEEVRGGHATPSNDEPEHSWRYRTKDDRVPITVEIRKQLASGKLRDTERDDGSLVVLIEERPKSFLGHLVHQLKGSPAGRLIANSSRPVCVCRPDRVWPPRTILCPVDRTVTSAAALDCAIDIARRVGATLEVLYVVTPRRSFAQQMGFLDLAEHRRNHRDMVRRARADLDDFLVSTRWRGVRWSRTVRCGTVDTEVARHAEQKQSDLVVIGRVPAAGGVSHLERHVAVRLLRRLPCSMLTIEPNGTAG